jgi:hypothetical protein
MRSDLPSEFASPAWTSKRPGKAQSEPGAASGVSRSSESSSNPKNGQNTGLNKCVPNKNYFHKLLQIILWAMTKLTKMNVKSDISADLIFVDKTKFSSDFFLKVEQSEQERDVVVSQNHFEESRLTDHLPAGRDKARSLEHFQIHNNANQFSLPNQTSEEDGLSDGLVVDLTFSEEDECPARAFQIDEDASDQIRSTPRSDENEYTAADYISVYDEGECSVGQLSHQTAVTSERGEEEFVTAEDLAHEDNSACSIEFIHAKGVFDSGVHRQSTSEVIAEVKVLVSEGNFGLERKKLQLGDQIGEGEFGLVLKGTYQGRTCAIKMLKDSIGHNSEEYMRLLMELSILASAGSHPNLVGFIGACIEDLSCPLIVEEYVDGPNLQEYLCTKKIAFELGRQKVHG